MIWVKFYCLSLNGGKITKVIAAVSTVEGR